MSRRLRSRSLVQAVTILALAAWQAGCGFDQYRRWPTEPGGPPPPAAGTPVIGIGQVTWLRDSTPESFNMLRFFENEHHNPAGRPLAFRLIDHAGQADFSVTGELRGEIVHEQAYPLPLLTYPGMFLSFCLLPIAGQLIYMWYMPDHEYVVKVEATFRIWEGTRLVETLTLTEDESFRFSHKPVDLHYRLFSPLYEEVLEHFTARVASRPNPENAP